MAQLMSVKLSRFDASPWGFRLQGGKDFGAPLLIQKVNGGSPAEKAGLQAGDAVIRVNEVELFHLRHKEAQDCIVRAGNNFELTVQRGGSTWKPAVSPVGPAPVNYSPTTNVQPVTKTSLAVKKPEAPQIGAQHNFAPKPYGGPQVNGDATVKSIVNKQYNTPVGIYSEETIAETLSAQAEVLAGGVLGVNFKKNERTYNAANSEVLKMVQEIDSEPRDLEPEPSVGGSVTSPPATGLRHVSAPETKPTPTTPHEDPFKVLPPGQNICADCERLIVGVFVRIKDKNLHVECFKCATCGTSLKNVGYYNINNKLYCDIHAKLVARQNPPAPNLEPITIPAGGRAPAGAISAALAKAPVSPASNFAPAPARAPAPTFAPVPSPARAPAPAPAPAPVSPGNLSPQPGTLGPLPFHAPSSLAGPKPFSTPSAPVTSPARPAPAGSKFVWPPKGKEDESSPTATPLYIPPSHHASGSGTPSGKSAPKVPPFTSVKSVPAPAPIAPRAPAPSQPPQPLPTQAYDRAAACPSPMISALTIAPERPYSPFPGSAPVPAPVVVKPAPVPAPVAIKPAPAPAVKPASAPVAAVKPPSQPPVPFPQPFSVFLAKHQQPMRPVSSPTPLQQPSGQPPVDLPLFQSPLQHVVDSAVITPNGDPTAEDLKAIQSAGLHKKFSVCSQEVFAINVDKPAPKFETLSEALETQMLVTSLTPDPVKRPESPIPMQDSKTGSIQDLTSTPEQEAAKQALSLSQPIDQVKTVATETVVPEAANPVSESIPPPVDRKPSVTTESIPLVPTERKPSVPAVSQSSESSAVQSVGITNVESEQFSSSLQSQSVSLSEQSVSSQQSQQSVVQYSETQSSSQVTVEKQEMQLSQSQTVSSQSVSGFVPVSRAQEHSATQFQQQTRQISSQQSSSVISAFTQPLPSISNLQSISQPYSLQAQNRAAACPSPLLSALTVAPERSYSPLPSATMPMGSVPIQSAPLSTQAPLSREAACPSPMLQALTIAPQRCYSPLPTVTKPMESAPVQAAPINTQPAYPTCIKPIAPAPLPSNIQPPVSREAACPSPLLSALTIAPKRPYSPLPPATLSMISGSTQVAPVSTQAAYPTAIKPVAPAPLPSSIQAPLARGAAYPSVVKPAPEQAYSPMQSAARPSGFAPIQTPGRPSTAPVPAAVKFSPSGFKPSVIEQPLRDETQRPLSSAPSFISKTEPARVTPKPVLPVMGAFRPIIPSSEFRPISDEIMGREPPSSFPPVTDELKAEFAIAPVARPKTPVQRPATPSSQRPATPSSQSRSGTPKVSSLGMIKPSLIPMYQQQMGEYSGQRPRSTTPSCPMLSQTSQFTKPEGPQKPSAQFQRQAPPQPYAAHQPVTPAQPPAPAVPVQPPAPAPAAAAPPSAAPVAQQPSIPFPNIPLPEGFKPDSLIGFKPVSIKPTSVPQQQQPSAPVFKPSPLAAPEPAPPGPVFKPSPLIAPSPLATPQPAPAAPQPSISAPMPATPKTIPISATQPTSIAKTPSAPSSSSVPNAGGGGGGGAPGGSQKGAAVAGSTAPRRGRGVLTQQSSGGRIPLCAHCNSQIRGPFITALGKNWCPEHFVCVNAQCRRPLADIGFVEEKGELYCEYCFEKYLAPTCDKCSKKIKGDCLNAIGKHFHPECFLCAYCGKLFGNNPFFLEDGLPYCETDWNELFTTKCFACGFPIEAGDRWVEALSNNYHSQCFNCTNCKKNLEGQSFYAKGGRPFCKAHAR